MTKTFPPARGTTVRDYFYTSRLPSAGRLLIALDSSFDRVAAPPPSRVIATNADMADHDNADNAVRANDGEAPQDPPQSSESQPATVTEPAEPAPTTQPAAEQAAGESRQQETTPATEADSGRAAAAQPNEAAKPADQATDAEPAEPEARQPAAAAEPAPGNAEPSSPGKATSSTRSPSRKSTGRAKSVHGPPRESDKDDDVIRRLMQPDIDPSPTRQHYVWMGEHGTVFSAEVPEAMRGPTHRLVANHAGRKQRAAIAAQVDELLAEINADRRRSQEQQHAAPAHP